jgi:phosphoenolpyruvate---glycerone phosphotransferase subunit DhaK
VKKLINTPESVVEDALRGLAAAHGDLVRVNPDPVYVACRRTPVAGKVGVLSGGGSGHEPLHTGFVGYGMLDAACPGDIFTSPTPFQVLEATRAVDGGAGVLHIVKNYTGDRLNFQMAAELARADGISVDEVVVKDDVAIDERADTPGRRGTGATLLVEKIAGAAAENLRPLGEVARVAIKAADSSRSMGLALTSCTVYKRGKPTFELAVDEMEIGIGIHGEAGRRRAKAAGAAEVSELLLGPILDDLPFNAGDHVLAFVNGMGGTPIIELYVLYSEVNRVLSDRGVAIDRSLVGSFVTSLEMSGCSLTLLKLDDELRSLWDSPVRTAALRWGA